ncbi:MAG: hypothetical protein ACOCUI_00165 [bacterium]
MVASGHAEAILICGVAGIGKTYVVEQTLEKYRKEHPSFRYISIGGDISKIGLYKSFYDNRKQLILFDDIDSVLSTECGDILKNAINTKLNRIISYKKSNRDLFNAKNMTEDEKYQIYCDSDKTKYPNRFQFLGSCIFISNKSLDEIDSAVKDRCIGRVYLDFSAEQIAQRISYVINDIEPKNGYLDINNKFEVLQFLYNISKKKGIKLSIRNFVNALSYKLSFPNEEWKDMIELYLN